MSSMYDNAMRAYDERRFQDAEPLFAAALAETLAPTERAALLFRHASVLDALDRRLDALVALRELIEIDSDSAKAWNNIGIICRKLERLEEAQAAFETAYRLDPSHAAPLISLGSVCLKRGDPGHALEYLQAAVDLEPGNAIAHANLSLTLAVFGRLEEAEDTLRLAVLYGFEQAEPIQQRIDALKEIRSAMLGKKEVPGDGSLNDDPPYDDSNHDAESSAQQHDIETLSRLEVEMHALAERQYLSGEDDPTNTAMMRQLRGVIRSLRREMGMSEVLESDVCAGVNYMLDDSDERFGE